MLPLLVTSSELRTWLVIAALAIAILVGLVWLNNNRRR
jgi:hypothetical protein